MKFNYYRRRIRIKEARAGFGVDRAASAFGDDDRGTRGGGGLPLQLHHDRSKAAPKKAPSRGKTLGSKGLRPRSFSFTVLPYILKLQ